MDVSLLPPRLLVSPQIATSATMGAGVTDDTRVLTGAESQRRSCFAPDADTTLTALVPSGSRSTSLPGWRNRNLHPRSEKTGETGRAERSKPCKAVYLYLELETKEYLELDT